MSVILKKVHTLADDRLQKLDDDVQFVITSKLIDDRITIFPLETIDGRKSTDVGYSLTQIGAVALAMDLLGQTLIATDDGVLDSLLDQVKKSAAAKRAS